MNASVPSLKSQVASRALNIALSNLSPAAREESREKRTDCLANDKACMGYYEIIVLRRTASSSDFYDGVIFEMR